jgi:two-component sensor histidine kinase
MSTTAEQDARFMRSLLAASDDCIKVIGLDGALNFMSEGGQRVMEISDFNAIRGCPWPDFWRDSGNGDAIAAIEAARQGRSSRFQGAADTGKGNPRFWDVQVSPILGPDGKPESILSVSRDITEFKLAEEQLRLLGKELSHRIKNTIALIQAVAKQTLPSDGLLADAKQAFIARLNTMSAAQDLLTEEVNAEALLGDIVAATVALHQADRFHVSGPEIAMSSQRALAMALTLHELATNAAKYGAISNETGHVDIVWKLDDTPEGQVLRFRWEEHDGPAVSPPSRKGFGSKMIERAIASYMAGESKADYAPTGFVFTLTATAEPHAAG